MVRGINSKNKYKLFNKITNDTVYCATRDDMCKLTGLTINQIRRLLKGVDFQWECKKKVWQASRVETEDFEEDDIKRNVIDDEKIIKPKKRVSYTPKIYKSDEGQQYIEVKNKKYLMVECFI